MRDHLTERHYMHYGIFYSKTQESLLVIVDQPLDDYQYGKLRAVYPDMYEVDDVCYVPQGLFNKDKPTVDMIVAKLSCLDGWVLDEQLSIDARYIEDTFI